MIFVLWIFTAQSCQATLVNTDSRDSVVAFPGAEGFGKFTTGGRGGKVYIVTNLNDSGSGSLREGIRMNEPRIIVFAVSGTIVLESVLNITTGDLTLAGQSAPGDGICIRNYPVKVKANNVIIRYLRFRLGDERQQQDDALSGVDHENIVIDHCSMSWATDECVSFYHNRNFTLQWCIISESLQHSVHEKGDHGYGGIWGGEGATFHHNLLASHSSRLPRFSGSTTTQNSPNELVDFRNNVIYNWMSNNTYGGEKGRYNVVRNYYKAGPATKSKELWIINPWSPYGKFFLNENYLYGSEIITKNNWKGVKADHPDSAYQAQAFPVEEITEQKTVYAYELVLRYAGASYKRDAVDARIVDEVKHSKATFGKNNDGIIDSQKDVGGWPELKSITPAVDTDQDGMADVWEEKNNLNPKDANDASLYTITKSYTNIEVYINQLVK